MKKSEASNRLHSKAFQFQKKKKKKEKQGTPFLVHGCFLAFNREKIYTSHENYSTVHLPIPFSETYCRLAFIAMAGPIYFPHCSLKKGMSNEFLLGESKCQGGILLARHASLEGRM